MNTVNKAKIGMTCSAVLGKPVASHEGALMKLDWDIRNFAPVGVTDIERIEAEALRHGIPLKVTPQGIPHALVERMQRRNPAFYRLIQPLLFGGGEIWRDQNHNRIVTEGLNHILTSTLNDGTKVGTWYIGLANASPTPAAGDTLASHGGWTENGNYSGTRKTWVGSAASGGSTNNSASPAAFVISTNTQTLGGAFLCSVTSGTSGILFSVEAFSGGNQAANQNDTINVTITISISDT